MKAQMEETQLKNRELMRQLAIARAKAGISQTSKQPGGSAARAGRLNGAAPHPGASAAAGRPSLRQRSAVPIHFRQPQLYGASDDEDGHTTDGDGDGRGAQRQHQRPFRRFDPTAYQLEKQRKMRMARSQSPSGANGNRQPLRRNSNAGGYTSDSSAGGYSSADSNGSNRSTRRGRARTRASAERQREVDARLASPKRALDQDTQSAAPRFKAPLPRPAPRANSRGRSPSPSTTQRRSIAERPQQPASTAAAQMPPRHFRLGQQRAQHPELLPAPATKRPASMKKRAAQSQHPAREADQSSKANALLADTSVDSFSDIDDRLNALQQFLKEAKHGSGASTSQKALG